MKHKFKKLKTKKGEPQWVLYCPKKDEWRIVFLSGFEGSGLTDLGQHFHCPCGELIEK